MSEDNISYLKALETVENEISSPAIGFSKDKNVLGDINTIGDKTIVRQNNIIIELLLQLNRKIDNLTSIITKEKTVDPSFQDTLEKINSQLITFSIEQKPLVKKPNSKPLVWQQF